MIRRIFLDLYDTCNTLAMHVLHYADCAVESTDYRQYPAQYGYDLPNVANHLLGRPRYTSPTQFWKTVTQPVWAECPTSEIYPWVLLLAGFSGCLHLDGLSDTADGLLSSRPRGQMLEIMHDSHAGAMGIMALVFALLAKFAALASLPAALLAPAVLLMPLAGRCAIVVHMALLPYARPSGLGAVFYRRPGVPSARPRWAAVWAAGVLAAVGVGILGWRGLVVWAVCLAAIAVFSAYTYRKIGGATGDTFGAVCEIMEAVPAIILAIVPLGGR